MNKDAIALQGLSVISKFVLFFFPVIGSVSKSSFLNMLKTNSSSKEAGKGLEEEPQEEHEVEKVFLFVLGVIRYFIFDLNCHKVCSDFLVVVKNIVPLEQL